MEPPKPTLLLSNAALTKATEEGYRAHGLVSTPVGHFAVAAPVNRLAAAPATPPAHVCSFRHVKRFLVTDTSQIVTHSLPLSGTVFGDSKFAP